jgi:hypothetical protein
MRPAQKKNRATLPTSLRRSEPSKRPGGPGGLAKDANQKSANQSTARFGPVPMNKWKPYLVIAAVSLLTIVLYKAVLKPLVPANIQAYLP